MAKLEEKIAVLTKHGINFHESDKVLWCVDIDREDFPEIDNEPMCNTKMLFLKKGIEKVGSKYSFYKSYSQFMEICEIKEEEDANEYIRKTVELGIKEDLIHTDEGYIAVYKSPEEDNHLVVVFDGDGCIIYAYPMNKQQFNNDEYKKK